MAFNPEFFITGLSELAPSTIAVFKAFAGPQKDKYGFLVYTVFSVRWNTFKASFPYCTKNLFKLHKVKATTIRVIKYFPSESS